VKQRETRRKIFVAAQMRSEGYWIDVHVLNISTRGLLVQTKTLPEKGSYVEICRGSQIVIGRVAWCNGRKFGVRTQDRIDVSAFVDHPSHQTAHDAAIGGALKAVDRAHGALALASPEQRLAHSVRMAAIFQFGALVFAGLLCAVFLMDWMHEILGGSMHDVSVALSGKE
jgi:hypothetical protein